MIKRQKITKLIAQYASNKIKLVSCLGRISRDIYSFVDEHNKSNCFFNVGAMGTTLPLALGLAIVIKDKKIYAIEGDGSILMNLGGLVTYKRYNPGNLTLFIIDNKQYETTGGQPSQPKNFDISKVCTSVGLKTKVIKTSKTLEKILNELNMQIMSFDVVIIKGQVDKISPRITEEPSSISRKFKLSNSII